jgi:hypothetical protein
MFYIGGAISESCDRAFVAGVAPQRMHTQALNLGAEAGFQTVLANNILIDRGRIQVPIKATGPIVIHRPEMDL